MCTPTPTHAPGMWGWIRHALFVTWLLAKWALQLIYVAGPVGIGKWLLLLARLVLFVLFLIPQVFLPEAWKYCTSGSILRDVPYGDNSVTSGRSVLDIYLPTPAYWWIQSLHTREPQKKRPVVIFVVGGAWIVGYKGWGALIARVLSAAGIICFLPDYRNYPQATLSDMVADCGDAISWIQSNLEAYGGDPENVVLVGQSAGAHLSLLSLVLPNRIFDASKIQAFVGISGPYCIPSLYDFFQSRGLYKSALDLIFESDPKKHSPTTYLTSEERRNPRSDLPPIYLFHGTNDNSVPMCSSTLLRDHLQSLGHPVACKLFEGHTHTAPIIEAPVGGDDPLITDLLHLFTSRQWGKLPPTGGFTGNMKEIVENSNCESVLKDIAPMVPRANPTVLKIAGWLNPF